MKKNALISVLIAVLALLLACLIAFYFKRNAEALAPRESTRQDTATTSLPSFLSIPKISLEANVEDVGLTADGAMDTPKNAADVGWYDKGPAPGEKGNAVIDGHLDTFLGTTAVFWKLDQLKPGDDIYVTDRNGGKLHFKVTKTAVFPYNATDTSAVFGPSDGMHLNLITCNGSWLGDAQSYNKRLVVWSDLTAN